MRAAVVNWEVRQVLSDKDFFTHLDSLLSACQDADLIVLPECFSLELLALRPDLEGPGAIEYLAGWFEDIEDRIAQFAARSKATVIGGSHFMEFDGGFANICPICLPTGAIYHQAKNKLTVYEREEWGLIPGRGLSHPSDHVGVTICYDSEFPEACRLLAEHGMLVLCVPAYTETQRGFQRVRWCSLARAVENQTFVIHSSLVGSLGREPVPQAVGTSAIIAPSIEPYPEAAILAETGPGEGVAFASLDLDGLLAARGSGDVRNWNDRDASNWFLNDP